MSRGVVELANFDAMGTLPLPAKAITNFDPTELSPTLQSLYPLKVALEDYHEFLFRMKRVRIRDLIVTEGLNPPVDYGPYLRSFYRNYTWEDGFGIGLPDERELLLYPGGNMGSAQWYDDPLLTLPVLSGELVIGNNPSFTVYDDQPDGSWPPKWVDFVLSIVGVDSVTIENPVIYDPNGQWVWPALNFNLDINGVKWSNVLWDAPSYVITTDPVALVHPLSTAGLPLYKYEHIPVPADPTTLTCADNLLRFETVEYFERRDANGQNPVWHATTGEQLIFPVPTDTDR